MTPRLPNRQVARGDRGHGRRLRHNLRMEKTTPGAVTTDSRIRYADVLSDDGTRIRAWSNDPDGTIDGPTVVLCNGLGTSPWAWPALLEPDCAVRVVSWDHRGVGGSARPRTRTGSASPSSSRTDSRSWTTSASTTPC